MSSPIIFLVTSDAIETAATVLTDHRITAAPVVDDIGRVVGVVSAMDLLTRTRPGPCSNAPTRVADVLTPHVVTVPADTPVPLILELMTTRNVERMLVTGGDQRIVGIVTRSDVVRAVLGRRRPTTGVDGEGGTR